MGYMGSKCIFSKETKKQTKMKQINKNIKVQCNSEAPDSDLWFPIRRS